MIRATMTAKNGAVVRIADDCAALAGTPEGDRIQDRQFELVREMMHRRAAREAAAREDIEYGDFDDRV